MTELAQAVLPRERRGLYVLIFGASAAPIAWLGQIMLAYGVTAFVCYPGDHPVAADAPWLHAALAAFDIIAILVALAGGITAWVCFRRANGGRVRFMALWGIFSSLCFLVGIVFNVIASLAVPPCA